MKEGPSCGIWVINETDSVLEIYARDPTRASFDMFGLQYSVKRHYIHTRRARRVCFGINTLMMTGGSLPLDSGTYRPGWDG